MNKMLTVLLLFISTIAKDGVLPPSVVKHKASFLIAYKIIRTHEGGYANVLYDIGEETYCGISRKFYKDWGGWPYIDEYKQKYGTPEWNYQFSDIIEWHVTDFYVSLWVKEGFSDLEDQALANYLFDFRIHSPLAVRIIQQQLNEFSHHFELDNQMNTAMIDALNKTDATSFLRSIREKRIDLYKHIVVRYPEQRKFLSHWLKRASV